MPKHDSVCVGSLGPVAVVGGVHVAVARAVAVVAGDARVGDVVGVLDGHGDPERVDAEVGEVAARDLLGDARPVAAQVVRRRRRRGLRAGHVAVVRRVAVEEAVDEDEVDDRVAPVEDARRAARAARRTCSSLGQVMGCAMLLPSRLPASFGRRRVARDRSSHVVPFDEELVLDRLVPRDVHRDGPRAARVRHRVALRPRAGAVVAAELDAASRRCTGSVKVSAHSLRLSGHDGRARLGDAAGRRRRRRRRRTGDVAAVARVERRRVGRRRRSRPLLVLSFPQAASADAPSGGASAGRDEGARGLRRHGRRLRGRRGSTRGRRAPRRMAQPAALSTQG